MRTRPVLVPDHLRHRLLGNAALGGAADPPPALKLFNPIGPATWLLTELAPDGDTLFGLCDLGLGFPELGYVSLAELSALRLPYGLRIARDTGFRSRVALSRWVEAARRTGSIRGAEILLGRPAGGPP